jgi:hypothetical protein
MTDMPRPFRLKVLDKLILTLKGISPANDYYFDLSQDGRVVCGRTANGDDEPLPLVSILEPPLAIEQRLAQVDNTGNEGDWDLLIQGWVPDGPDQNNPIAPAYTLVAEVIQALAKAKRQKRGNSPDIFGMGAGFGDGAGIEDLRIGAPVVRPPDETSARACFYLIVTFKIAEDMSDPFG